MKNSKTVQILTAPLAALFFYAGSSKLLDYDRSSWEMRNQIFPAAVAETFTWLIPVIEIALTLLILFPETRKKGLWGSVILLGAFSLYIAVIQTEVFGRVPCSCGGILRNMPHSVHLLFNLFFIGLALGALAYEYNYRIYPMVSFFKRKEKYKESA